MNDIALSLQESRLRDPAAAKSGHSGGGTESDMQSILKATGCQVWLPSCLTTWEWAPL